MRIFERQAGIFIMAAAVAGGVAVTPIAAATPRQTLADAAFVARTKSSALAQIDQAHGAAEAMIAKNPRDRDALLVAAMATGYRAKLTKNRGEALAARKQFEALAASDPRDPEAIAAVGTWHLDSVAQLGGMVAGMVLGAKKATGLAALDRAVSLGGDRAMFAGLAALLRLSLDPADPRARGLAEAAAKGSMPTPLDRQMQRSAEAILVPLRAGSEDQVQALAKLLLPFGRLKD
jgi:hypothetical protein